MTVSPVNGALSRIAGLTPGGASPDEARYRALSLWWDGHDGPITPRPPLSADTDVDVAIVCAQLTRFGICLQYILETADPPAVSLGPIGLGKNTLNDRGDVRKVQSALQEGSDCDFIRRIEDGRCQPPSVRYSPS